MARQGKVPQMALHYIAVVDFCKAMKMSPREYWEQEPEDIFIFSSVLAGQSRDVTDD